jgi:hypothetical protein
VTASFFSRVVGLICLCSLQVGCVPAVLQRTPHVVGHVADARTHRPVPQAQVKFHYLDKPVTHTDAAGRFELPKTHELTLVWFLPLDRLEAFTLDVTKAGYLPAQVRVPLGAEKPVDVQLKANR